MILRVDGYQYPNGEMYEWKVQYSETKKAGTRLSCECWTATVFAEDED